jgi:RHS repeat-associated protein
LQGRFRELAGIGYLADPTLEDKFTYNGKEKVDDLALNWLDYGARNYDARLGRFWSVDGRAEKYLSFSPYHYCANNPLRFLDVDGNEFTQAAEAWAGRLEGEVDRKIAANIAEITRLLGKVAGKTGKQGLDALEKIAKKINKLSQENNGLSTTRSELSILRNSSQLYHVETTSGEQVGADGSKTAYSTTTFDKSIGAVVMTINSSGGNELASFAHEAKHAFQFETKKMGFNYETGRPSDIYDLTDEVEAFKRGQLFGANSNATITGNWVRQRPNSKYKQLPQGPRDANSLEFHPGLNTTRPISEVAAFQTANYFMGNRLFFPTFTVIKDWQLSIVGH